MNTSVSVYYPIDRAPARRDLALGVLVSVAALAGAYWAGNAARHPYLPTAAASHHDQAIPLPPPIDIVELRTDDTAPAPDTKSPVDVATLPEVRMPITLTAIIQPPEPTRPHLTVDSHALTVPPTIGTRTGDPVYNPDTLDAVPVATFQPAPNYPYALKRAGVSGTVTIDFIVETNGTTSHVMVAGGRPEFGENAVQAVSHWRFHPGRKLGRTVRTHMVVPVRFSLETDQ